MKIEEARKLVNLVPWYHSFEILPGLVTPGSSIMNAEARLNQFNLPKDLTGKTALDIGTWDGPVAFELEKRGARVTALDIHNPRKTGFATAKKILGSKVRYIQGNVYDLSCLPNVSYDYIFFCGIYYHLTNPVGAFRSISEIMSDNSQLFYEGELILNYAEKANNEGIVSKIAARLIAKSKLPICLVYPGNYFKGASNWFIPNQTALMNWFAASGLTSTWHQFYRVDDALPYPHQRIFGAAQKIEANSLEHPLYL